MPKDGRTGATSLKHRLLEGWVARRLGSLVHERRVVTVATTLFRLTRPLHGLGVSEEKMLALAAVVHDVGRSVDEADHPREGARMVLADNWLPITPTERRTLAYLTRFHRGTVPELGRDGILTDADSQRKARLLLALLRAADTLDSRSLESPRLLFSLRNRRLTVDCYLEDDSTKARKTYTRRKKFRLMEDLLNCRVDVNVHASEELNLVA